MEDNVQPLEGHLKKNKTIKRRWNLVLLGIISVVVALLTTSVSLLIYHNSGDIYLDRSRPGYLPDEDEIEDGNDNTKYVFEKTGKIDMIILEEYLDNFNLELQAIDEYEKPFGAGALSNEELGIPLE